MMIDKIAAKLRPLLPDQIAQWTQARELADPQLKSLIEKQIIYTAYKVFGDFPHKILLSLPPETKAKGSIHLGKILYDKEKWELGISQSELLQNMGIFGRSGSGKTNLAFHLIQQLDQKQIPYLFFDNKRTLRHLIPQLRHKVTVYTPGRSLSSFHFNPFITPPGLEPSVYINQMIDVLAHAFTLGDGSKSIMQKAILTCYHQGNTTPTVQDIIAEIEAMESKDRIRSWKISALRALETLRFANITADKTSQEALTQQQIEGNTLIELDSLDDNVRKFLIPLIYQWLYQVKLCSGAREQLTLAVFIDEAHMFFDTQSGGSLMERLLRQTRELGIATIVMDQTPSLMSKVVLANCYTNVFFNLVSTGDLNKAASVCLLDTEDQNYFSRLPVGQGIVKLQDRWSQPFLLQFPLVSVKKGFVTDAMLARYSAVCGTNRTGSGRKNPLQEYFGQVPRVPRWDIGLDEAALQLLQDVMDYPDDGVKVRYWRLGLSIGTGNRLKDQLLNQGWLESQTVILGTTRKLCLRLTRGAQETFGPQTIAKPYHGSIVHDYWQRFYAQRLREQGYQVELEVPRPSGRVDVVASQGDKRIAIEIETGKSDFLRNLRQDLAAHYDKIIIVATDPAAYAKIEKQLALHGLLIPERVTLVLRDALGPFTFSSGFTDRNSM